MNYTPMIGETRLIDMYNYEDIDKYYTDTSVLTTSKKYPVVTIKHIDIQTGEIEVNTSGMSFDIEKLLYSPCTFSKMVYYRHTLYFFQPTGTNRRYKGFISNTVGLSRFNTNNRREMLPLMDARLAKLYFLHRDLRDIVGKTKDECYEVTPFKQVIKLGQNGGGVKIFNTLLQRFQTHG